MRKHLPGAFAVQKLHFQISVIRDSMILKNIEKTMKAWYDEIRKRTRRIAPRKAVKGLLKRKKTIACIAFLVFAALTVLTAAGLMSMQKKRAREQAGYVIEGEIGKLQYAMDSRILDTNILEMIIVDSHGKINDFERVAAELRGSDPCIRSLQLAPNGVVSYVYPLEGNEKAFGDLFASAKHKTEAEYARDSGKTTLAGPYELNQGGRGAVARNPIYLEDETGPKSFWGFSIVIFNVPEIFEKAGIDNLASQGYAYRIWRINPDSREKEIIIESTADAFDNPVTTGMTVPNGSWTLEIIPTAGWLVWKDGALLLGIGLIISALLAAVLYAFFVIEEKKRELERIVHVDQLTGIYNRRYFTETIAERTGAKAPFGLLYLDVDEFKSINDRYGHYVGDLLLAEIAVRIRDTLHKTDKTCRLGGDEFAALILEAQPEAFYTALRTRIQAAVEQPFRVDDKVLIPKISCGYARYPEDKTTQEGLISLADERMYREKSAKK